MSECTGALRRANECAAACACARRSHAPFSERFVSKPRFQPRVFVRAGCPPQIHCRTKQSISHKGQKRQFIVKCDNCFSLLRTKKFRATASVVIFFIVNSRQCTGPQVYKRHFHGPVFPRGPSRPPVTCEAQNGCNRRLSISRLGSYRWSFLFLFFG